MTGICLAAGDMFIPIKVEEDHLPNIKKLISILKPHWPLGDVNFKVYTDGITNKLVGCQLKTDNNENNIILVRVYGNKTDLLIDRQSELRNLKCLYSAGLAPKVYAAFENGLVYQYCPGVTLDVQTVLSSNVWPLVATQLAKMHKVHLPTECREPMVWSKIEQFLCLIPEPLTDPTKHERFVKNFGSVTKLRLEYEKLKSLLSQTESPIVFAHNDLLLGNVIHNQHEDRVSFIDYEYAAYNYQAFDIANHFNEFVGLSIKDIDYKKYPSKEFQEKWLNVYLQEYLGTPEPPSDAVEKLYEDVEQLCIASHFFWGVWSIVQYELSAIDFDFGRYAEIRLSRYFELRDKIFKQLRH